MAELRLRLRELRENRELSQAEMAKNSVFPSRPILAMNPIQLKSR